MTYLQVGPGEEVESAHMNAAINQGVIPFANAAARDAAIPAPVLGMMCYLQDSGTLQQHNGFVWVGDPHWASVPLESGWAGTAQLRMAADGTVHLHVLVTHTAATNQKIGTIPVKYTGAGGTWYGTGHVLSAGARYACGFAVSGSTRAITWYNPPGTTTASVTEFNASMSWRSNFLDVR